MGNLNTKQRIVIIAGMLVLVLMILFPPFVAQFRGDDKGITMFVEYGFFFKRNPEVAKTWPLKIDTARITLQLLALFGVVGGLTLVLADRKKETASQEKTTVPPGLDVS